uniref:VPS9 domain-containing protein n=1 Tax=Hyaloperonospora arabidopsidis (strain Emoy2) TaxID=559515 RepID=M4C507_HYAAE
MFWGLRSSSSSKSSASAAATSRIDASRRSSQQAQNAADTAVLAAPSYVLSEQRRSDLLLAARTTRTSWVDNVDAIRDATSHFDPLCGAYSSVRTALLSSAWIAALDDLHNEFSSFFANLDELKRQLLPKDLQLVNEEGDEEEVGAAGTPSGSIQRSSRKYVTLFQELSEQKPLLDQWQRSHSPQTSTLTRHGRDMYFLLAFRELLALLKNTRAADLVYRIQSFVKKAELWDLPQMMATRDRPGGKIQDFINKLVEQIKHDKVLTALMQGNADDEDAQQTDKYLQVRNAFGVDLLHEVLEAFLMEKLYVKTLTPSDEVAGQDDAFHNRITLLAFVTFKHLDLPEPETDEQAQTWLRLATQLDAATLYPSPRRKMDGVLRVCQDLTSFLKMQNGDRFPSADEFLPALIYVVLHANPCELKRNVAYILEYRNPSKLVSEPGYFFTHLVSSIAFLEEVDCSRLTISAEEFSEGLRRSTKGVTLSEECRELDLGEADDDCDNRCFESGNAAVAEGRKQMSTTSASRSRNVDDDRASLGLPTVLDVRAKRLSLMSDYPMRGSNQAMHRQTIR